MACRRVYRQQLASSFVNGNDMAAMTLLARSWESEQRDSCKSTRRAGKDSQHRTTVESKTGTKVKNRG